MYICTNTYTYIHTYIYMLTHIAYARTQGDGRMPQTQRCGSCQKWTQVGAKKSAAFDNRSASIIIILKMAAS